MKYLYHLHVRPLDAVEMTYSCDTYEKAKGAALFSYRNAAPDTLVEITHAGLIVWGPYVVGSRYNPGEI